MAYPVEKITPSFIAEATGGEIVFGDGAAESVTTDSRDTGDLFIALSGERFDGNKFIPSACENGAKGYVSDGDCSYRGCEFGIKVKDCRKALADIAAAYRKRYDVPLVGVTGSVGKTTTKEFIASVLRTEKRIIKTQGNFNNEIGLPLTLFSLRSDTEAGVIEMGMSNFGEISRLTRCALPKIAVISNIGESHIEYLGSKQGILKAKCEIFEGLPEDGTVILNGDDELLYGLKGKIPFKTIYCSTKNRECDIVAENITVNGGGISFTAENEEYSISMHGTHNVLNALLAIAVGRCFGISDKSIKAGLASCKSDGIRQSITEKNGIRVITDCYNAAPTSVKAAIDMLCDEADGRTVAVLGDMAELGEKSPEYHAETGAYAVAKGVSKLVLIGKFARFTAEGAKGGDFVIFESLSEAERYLKENLKTGDTVLFKGSRIMKLEELAEKFN